MYRRSCGRTAERIDASRRPRIDLRVVKLTGGLRTTSSPPVLPESQAVRRGVPPYSETRGTCPRMACAGRPSADRKKGNMTLTVWTGWTTSSAALQAAAAVADFFFS